MTVQGGSFGAVFSTTSLQLDEPEPLQPTHLTPMSPSSERDQNTPAASAETKGSNRLPCKRRSLGSITNAVAPKQMSLTDDQNRKKDEPSPPLRVEGVDEVGDTLAKLSLSRTDEHDVGEEKSKASNDEESTHPSPESSDTASEAALSFYNAFTPADDFGLIDLFSRKESPARESPAVIKLPEDVAGIEVALASVICITHAVLQNDIFLTCSLSELARHASALFKVYPEDSGDRRMTKFLGVEDLTGTSALFAVDGGESDDNELDSQWTDSTLLRVESLEIWQYDAIMVLLHATGLPPDSSMALLDFVGECFVCERCEKAKGKKLYSWKILVTHFLDKYEEYAMWQSPALWGGPLPFPNSHDVCAPGSLINVVVTEPGMEFPWNGEPIEALRKFKHS